MDWLQVKTLLLGLGLTDSQAFNGAECLTRDGTSPTLAEVEDYPRKLSSTAKAQARQQRRAIRFELDPTGDQWVK